MTARADTHSAFGAREVVSGAAYAGRRHWRRVLIVALVIFGVTALLETVIDTLSHNSTAGWIVVIGAVAFAVDIFGEVFFTGVLDRLVGEAAHGHSAQSVPTILRTLPYGQLIIADILLIILVALGLLLFVVPALVIFTLLCLSGPIVNIEGLPAVRALRRSARLVRRRFWLAFFLVSVPLFIADWIAGLVQDAAHSLPLPADFGIHWIVATAIAIATGLVQVELAHRLIEADAENRAASDGGLA